ncbi:DUF4965 domain-containing protein [Arsenicitalea aurantiaca]|uniref:DUF4965 domain-containing protein n=1 Tax=Arsenicitalea aurantiaca TaxID=1783274 RepID=A0A433X483_9HYPH|nr:glutaminase family protein [Arsenicitalea aurantiaca]RUT28874.1 DUF4965 domain-containing protein [Arsenicitalea aurantiaca]
MRSAQHPFPAIPLVTIDPYTSIWSMADRLTDDWPRHWTGTKMALYGVVRVDGTPHRFMGGDEWLARAAEQLSCTVEATVTRYVFACGGIELDVDFLTPLLADDLDLMSRPVTYIRLRARSVDGKAHAVSAYIDMSGEIAVNLPHERVYWDDRTAQGLHMLSFRAEDQRPLAEAGDHRRIDWGTGYLAGRADEVEALVGDINVCRDSFAEHGRLSAEGLEQPPRKVDYNSDAILAITTDLSIAAGGEAARTIFVGYDDEVSIEYFGKALPAWWRRDGTLDGPAILARAAEEEETIVARCAEFDRALHAEAREAGGEDYATLIDLTWRQTIAAHKLVAGPDGQPLFMSKENFSNGCIATVDVTYPSAPMFLAFNPLLVRAMIDPIFEYCAGGVWPHPFPAHDLGTYPKANGQVYRGFDPNVPDDIIKTQMPVEESGNMLILTASLALVEGNAAYAERHWGLLRQWADYLVEVGFDPGEQLCTDDFSGVLGHNVNLSAKAIMGIAGFAMLARMCGKDDEASHYRGVAERFAADWVRLARDGEGTRLAFNQEGSWSLKYNLVWDRLFGFDLLPEAERRREHAFYRTQMNAYGIPLDNRSSLTKPEWMLWGVSLADDRPLFEEACGTILRYLANTPNRVPFSDLYFTANARKRGFQARSVLGGLHIRLLEKRLAARGAGES